MKCLSSAVSFDIFMDNYFTSFRQLTLLRVHNIRAARGLNKNMLRKCTIIQDKQLRKKGTLPLLNSIDQAKSSVTLIVVR